MTNAATVTTRFTEATRHAIVQAAVELLLERRGDNFSVQEVAKRAGLTHRTVYRHFPTRQELLATTARELSEFTDERFEEASTVDEWIAAVALRFDRAEQHCEIVRSVLVAAFAADDSIARPEVTRDRDAHRREIFRRQFPHLSESDARFTFATLRHLLSSTSYLLYRLRFGLSPAQATRAIQSAARDIAAGAGHRNRTAARSRKCR